MPSLANRPQSSKFSLSRLLSRFILALCFMSGLMYFAGPTYIRTFLPIFSKEINKLHPEYEIREFSLNEKNQLMFEVRVNRPKVDQHGRLIGGTEVRAGIQGWVMYTAPIIIFSILLAWPGLTTRTRAKAFLIAFILLILSQLIDIPIHCINRIEAPWPSNSGLSEARKFWAYVLSNGGRQFMAFFIALFSVLSAKWAPPSWPDSPIGRNAPCPCGSGKKFKKCCGK